MINLFLIKNKLKNKTNIQNNNNEIIEKYKRIAQSGNEEVIKEFYTNIEKGLTEKVRKLQSKSFRIENNKLLSSLSKFTYEKVKPPIHFFFGIKR